MKMISFFYVICPIRLLYWHSHPHIEPKHGFDWGVELVLCQMNRIVNDSYDRGWFLRSAIRIGKIYLMYLLINS